MKMRARQAARRTSPAIQDGMANGRAVWSFTTPSSLKGEGSNPEGPPVTPTKVSALSSSADMDVRPPPLKHGRFIGGIERGPGNSPDAGVPRGAASGAPWPGRLKSSRNRKRLRVGRSIPPEKSLMRLHSARSCSLHLPAFPPFSRFVDWSPSSYTLSLTRLSVINILPYAKVAKHRPAPMARAK